MGWPTFRKPQHNIKGWTNMEFPYLPHELPGYMAKSAWIWPFQRTQYQAGGLNCWTGNQLPGDTNFIPGVLLTEGVGRALWYNHRELMNTPQYVTQFNRGYNVGGLSSSGASLLLQQATQAWQNGQKPPMGEAISRR